MSFTIIRYLYCDSPECQRPAKEPFRIAPNIDEPVLVQRIQAQRAGWYYDRANSKDYCEECWPDIREKRDSK